MGRPARNYGGTGGHGCPPLPGEGPNLNCHVMSDKTLLTMVQDTRKRPRRTPKIEILKDFPTDGMKANKILDSISLEEPKQSELQSEPVASLKETEEVSWLEFAFSLAMYRSYWWVLSVVVLLKTWEMSLRAFSFWFLLIEKRMGSVL